MFSFIFYSVFQLLRSVLKWCKFHVNYVLSVGEFLLNYLVLFCLFLEWEPWWHPERSGSDSHQHLCDTTSRCKCWSTPRRCWRCAGALWTQRCCHCLCLTVRYHLQPEPELSNWPQVYVWVYSKDPDGTWYTQAFSQNPGTQKQTAGMNAWCILLQFRDLEALQCTEMFLLFDYLTCSFDCLLTFFLQFLTVTVVPER